MYSDIKLMIILSHVLMFTIFLRSHFIQEILVSFITMDCLLPNSHRSVNSPPLLPINFKKNGISLTILDSQNSASLAVIPVLIYVVALLIAYSGNLSVP
jgi:hypothetical protein